MAIKAYRPTTPGRRGMTSQDFDSITSTKPLRSLLRIKKGAVGRNNQGRITTRHRGAGVKRYYRVINFRLAPGTTATVEEIEYDPNRSARIARIKDQDGKYHYILASRTMKPGKKIKVDEETAIQEGNRLPLKNIPTGSQIHAIELQPGKGAQLVRSAGAKAQLLSKEGTQVQVKLPSGEVRILSGECTASLGIVGNEQHQNIQFGKAGRKRHLGIRPTVRGVVMAAVDHPHGGGEGKHGTEKDPRTPWGQKTLGYKTRRRKNTSKYIARTRHEGRRR